MPNPEMNRDKERLLKILRENAFFKEKVVLSSGKESDFYIDARRVTLSPEGAYLCANILLEMVRGDNVDALGGPTLGADPLAGAIASLSFQLKKPVRTFIVRKAPKPYGKQQQIEGPLLKKGMRVVIIDDVATSGKAIIQSVDVLRQMGMEVVKAVCIVDRQEGAKEALAEKHCPLFSIFSISDITQ